MQQSCYPNAKILLPADTRNTVHVKGNWILHRHKIEEQTRADIQESNLRHCRTSTTVRSSIFQSQQIQNMLQSTLSIF